MTREEILAMFPGKELDWMIADWLGVDRKLFNFAYETGTYNYSTDISAAWEVVEKMRAENWPMALDSEEGKWIALFYWDPHKQDFECEAKSAPEAICKAALLAVLEGKA